jgi:transcription elongation factor Elf1
MKSRKQLQETLNTIIQSINVYSDKLVDAMCDGKDYEEQMYNREIETHEDHKGFLEWVLN